jgi:hypothetical protein
MVVFPGFKSSISGGVLPPIKKIKKDVLEMLHKDGSHHCMIRIYIEMVTNFFLKNNRRSRTLIVGIKQNKMGLWRTAQITSIQKRRAEVN